MSSVTFRLTLTALIFLLGSSNSHSNAYAVPELVVKRLPENSTYRTTYIYHITQLSSGFLLFCTQSGAQLYDGYQFIPLKIQSDNKESSPLDVAVHSAIEDSNKDVWLATNVGLFKYSSETAELEKIDFKSNGVLNIDIREIIQDKNGNLWLGTLNGVIKYNPQTKESKGYSRKVVNDKLVPSGKVLTLLEHKNKVWVGTNGGLFYVELDKPESNELVPHMTDVYITSSDIIDEDTLWFGTDQLGIYKYDTNTETAEVHESSLETPLELKTKSVWYVYKAPSGRIWIGYWDKGITVYDPVTKLQFSLEHRPSDNSALPGDTVEMITADHTGAVWITTSNGAAIFNPQTITFQRLRQIADHPNSLSSGNVASITEDKEGIAWIGTSQGLEKWDTITNHVNPIKITTKEGKPLNTNTIWRLDSIDDDYLILITDAGALKFNKNSNQAEWLSPNTLGKIPFYSLAKLPNENFLISSSAARIFLVDAKKEHSRLIYDASQHSITSHIEYFNIILNTTNETVWLGSPTGLYQVTFENNYSIIKEIKHYFRSQIIHDLQLDSKNNIWVATANNGIHVIPINNPNEILKTITVEDGLPSNNVLDLIFQDNQLWFSTNELIGQIDAESYKLQIYPQVSSKSLRFIENCSWLTPNDFLYLCGTEIIGFDPQILSFIDEHYPIRLTKVERMHKPDTRFKPLADVPELEFFPDDSLLTFHFSQLDYLTSDLLHYEYKLQGYDKNWLSPKNINRASYTHLPDGSYQLKVRSTNQLGEWSKAKTILNIKMHPPWWKTSLAKFIYLVLAVTTIVLIYCARRSKRRQELAAMEAIKRSEENLRDVLWGSGDQYWRWDLKTNLIHRTSKLKLNEIPKEECIQSNDLFDRIHPEDQSLVDEMIVQHINGHCEHYEAQFRILDKDDKTWHWVLSRGRIVERDENDKPAMIAGTTKDINELKLTEDRLRHLANFDQLTELPNRSMFHEQMKHALSLAKRFNDKIALIFFDLNSFKMINDSMGHATGDQLLQAVAHRLRNILRDTDNTARLGGDEFTIILERVADHDDIIRTINRLIEEMSQPFDLTIQSVITSVSIGVSIYPEDGKTTDELLKHADIAMYEAKRNPDVDYCFYHKDMNASLVHRMGIERDLENAIANDEFKTYFQPRVDVKSNTISGFEALIRWIHPEKGLVSPGDFIPVAEESGKIIYLGSWILFDACKQCSKWHNEGHHVNVSVNIAAMQFQQSDLINIVEQAIKSAKIPPESLELEITEGTLIRNLEHTRRVLYDLKRIGVKIALDDFGTGYSSLAYLQQLPIDVLKIDRSFIIQLSQTKKSAMLCKAIINMAHSLDIEVVAEGVETEEQLEFIRESMCEEYQGFLFGKPQPIEEIKYTPQQYWKKDH
ncbi:EAL domain-containing protein [Pleionea sediminis]|uniref:EAL domain-containing protein n=1 Tax=Pleionea sediminis TaxID=2569479 RepID=UPI0013DE13E6|nr:EAL domain-containing protein [Pleionea sediminis]